MTDDERFEAVFRENVRRRSRTAAGKDKGSETSSSKKPLALQGEALAAKVAENTGTLIADVSAGADRWAREIPADDAEWAEGLRSASERWFDIVNDGLYGADAYADEIAQLEKDAARLGPLLGTEFSINRRYRLWTPQYTTVKASPLLLEPLMDSFYAVLGGMLSDLASTPRGETPYTAPAAAIMAYADLMMDGELHPWMDGCGRVSTALVMCISRVLRLPPPLFAETKDGHYATIRDQWGHTHYYVRALGRGDTFGF